MKVSQELLIRLLSEQEIHIVFPNLPFPIEDAIESQSCAILQKIKQVLEDESLDDSECFQHIEKILELFRQSGISVHRHDFG